MSLLKEIDKAFGRKDDGRLYYGRMLEDGMPFRGQYLHLREEEYEELVETVHDTKVKLFDLSKPADLEEFQQVQDRRDNNWYIVRVEDHKMIEQPDGSVKVFVYCVWSIPHKQLNKQRAQTYGPLLG